MKNLYPTIMTMLGVKLGAQNAEYFVHNGEFSYIIAGITACVLFSAFVLSGWVLDFILGLFLAARLKWSNRKQ